MSSFGLVDDTAADSTQDPHTKESKQTCQAETSSSTQAESSSSVQEKETDEVGSSNNGISTAIKQPEGDMIPESSSDAQEKEVMPVVSSMEAEPSNAEPSTHQEPVEQVSKSQKSLFSTKKVIVIYGSLHTQAITMNSK